MMKRVFTLRISVLILAVMLIVETSGCAAFKKKFTRPRKEVKFEPVYFEPEVYGKKPNSVLYKQYYIFWKTWHEELISRIDQTHQKAVRCASETVINLNSMKKFLAGEKADKLQAYIDEMTNVKGELNKRYLSSASKMRMKRKLETAYRQIKREFAYKKVIDHILPDAVPQEEPQSEEDVK